MAAVQSSQLESLEVRESGRALKVQTDNPHLVSIGSGRLSTNVTWHPLPEGKVTLGTDPEVDIILQGTGVQPKHCIIENVSSIVTLYPLAEMTTVDGVQITSATRLCQGNMLCIGRSNYLRFNHPAEANLMKKYLPNTRISMAAPLNYFGSGDGFHEKKPPITARRSRDSWGEVGSVSGEEQSSVGSKSLKFDIFSNGQSRNTKSISPKVFPAGSATVNSPASAVLGHSRIPNGLLSSSDSKSRNNSVPATPIAENGNIDYIEPPVPQTISSYPQKPMVSSFSRSQVYQQNGIVPLEKEFPENRIHSPKILSLPSPAFNRNPSPYVPDKSRTTATNKYMSRSLSPSDRTERLLTSGSDAFSENDSPVTSLPQDAASRFCSNPAQGSDLPKHNLESKMVQVQNEKVQMLEKQRLDEILNMCAEYERQVQNERQTKVPTTPTLHQNRIKTNGSLPRDKRNNGLSSPLTSNSDDELNQIFTFDTSKPSTRNCIYDNVRIVNNVLHMENPEKTSKSPYENISKSEDSQRQLEDLSALSRHGCLENTLNDPKADEIIPPQSPRTRIRTTLRDQSSKELPEPPKQLPGFEDYDTADPVKFRDPASKIQTRKFLTPSQQLNKFNYLSSSVTSNQEKTEEDKSRFILPLDQSNDLSELMTSLEREFSATLSELNDSDKSFGSSSEVQKDNSWANDELNNDLPESERDIHLPEKQFCDRVDNKRADIFLRQKKANVDWGKLKVEKSSWLSIVARLKSDINNLEQQEEEVLREVKMEMALLNAEYLTQKEKHKIDEEKLTALKDKQKQLDLEIEHCKARDSEIQRNRNERIRKLKEEIQVQEEIVGAQKDSSEEYKNLLEKLEMEKKTFEDLEFKHLEEEANWLTSKDELQKDIHDISGRLEARKARLTELEDQIRETELISQSESSSLELRKIKMLQQLEEARTKMKDLDVRLSAESARDCFSEPEEGSGSPRESDRTKRSQEVLVRISKVTSDAPIDVGKTGSLGRKTIESLKEIERNRQIHLAKQGSIVIEEERKRVEQLKRRVQDEVRAQWEQSRQRESNSLNSVGSEDSNVSCSDQPTESMSGDEVEKGLPSPNITLEDARSLSDGCDKMRKDSDAGEFRSSRPVSDYSGSECEQQVNVKKRETKTMRLIQQRPLTRYLPIKSESLNLRQHIESAGHQVDLCPHILLDATSCKGFLHKLGGKFHYWNKRWFVFDRTKRTLFYYGDKTEKKQRGGTYFQAIEEVYVDHLNSVKSPNPQVTFVIKTRERNYYLMAPSPEAMRIWVDVIFTGAEGYQEFEHGS